MNTNTTDTTLPMDWQLGAASSCLNDIGNDDFPQILRIEEASDDDDDDHEYQQNLPIIRLNSRNLDVPEMQMGSSTNSISNILDNAIGCQRIDDGAYLSVGEMKPSTSDISISHILDQDSATENFDEHTFANVNTNALSAPVLKPSSSDTSISYYFDQA